MDRLQDILGGVRNYWENLTNRERMLLGTLGFVAGAMVILLPVWLLSQSINELQEENEEITAALREISGSRDQIAAQQAQRAAALQRYSRRAPSLGSFLEAKAGEHEGVSLSDVQHEPEREADGFRVRLTRARFQNVGLRPAIMFLASLKNSRYPVVLERVHVDHHRTGDQYNFQVGLLAFDREGGATPDAGAGGGADDESSSNRQGGRRRAGPPTPQ